jgi:hypothetical protein
MNFWKPRFEKTIVSYTVNSMSSETEISIINLIKYFPEKQQCVCWSAAIV